MQSSKPLEAQVTFKSSYLRVEKASLSEENTFLKALKHHMYTMTNKECASGVFMLYVFVLFMKMWSFESMYSTIICFFYYAT